MRARIRGPVLGPLLGGLVAASVAIPCFAGPTGSVSGVATDAGTGSALQGVAVSAVQGSTTVKQTMTSTTGAYTLSSLAPGTYDIVASKTGFANKSVAAVSVLQNKTTKVNLALTALPQTTGQISGTITDSSTSGPIAGATVNARQGLTLVRSATTDTAGGYLLPDLAAGDYELEAAAAGYPSGASGAVTVTVGATTTVNLTLTEGNRGIRIGSISSAGVLADGQSFRPSVSSDGRYVAFESDASNLVAGDTNAVNDIFVHDFVTGVTERVSVATGGTQANGASSSPLISADGRYVLFASAASNLAPGDKNKLTDLFLRDRTEGTTVRIAENTPTSPTKSKSMSSDGRYVAFSSSATNLVPGDTNNVADVFVYDRTTGAMELVSRNSSGVIGNGPSDGPALSADGRYVAFMSYASNLVAGDTNNQRDVFVKDRVTGAVELVSVSISGANANNWSPYEPDISADGRFVAFTSYATNLGGSPWGLGDVYLRDRQVGTTELISVDSNGIVGNSYSGMGTVSSDGRFVAFLCGASNLAPGDSNGKNDIFVRDRLYATTEAVSLSNSNQFGNSGSFEPVISRNGRYVVFSSSATNFAVDDTNNRSDVFLRDYWRGPTSPVVLDEDADGVPDSRDLCPNTPPGQAVDSNGCAWSQRDDDGDGVANGADLCPSTAAGQTVDAGGCAWYQRDDDGDGVANGTDLCSGTSAGQPVDSTGCSHAQHDDDGDGVANGVDLCPNTTVGQPVDASGCAAPQRDTDGDGVPDDRDLCPLTPVGEAVDVDGCALSRQDTDGDGVPDDRDSCPSTPPGLLVGANGCLASESDTDGDGVRDDRDLCPGTAVGEAVDVNGCSFSQGNDSDGDGVSNYIEAKLGTDPLDPAHAPMINVHYEYGVRGELGHASSTSTR